MTFGSDTRSTSPSLLSPIPLTLLIVAVVIGALLRLIGNYQPFTSSDHAEVAAIVSYFYPRNWQMLIPSESSTWNMLTNPHGMLSLILAFVSISVVGLLGIPITEFWWNLPFVLVHLAGIPLTAVLVKRLAGTWAGILAAFLITLMPIHAVMSRASGVGNMPLTFECQMLTLLMLLRYAEQPNAKRARHLGIALAVNLLVELFFPLLFVLVLGTGVLAVGDKRTKTLIDRINRARALLFVPRVMMLPMLVLLANLGMLLLKVNGYTEMGGLSARLMTGSDRQPGIHLNDFINNSTYVVGWVVVVILALLGVANWRAAKELRLTSLPLYWSILYLMPFLIFSRPHVFEYFLLGLAPLLLNAAIVLGSWLRSDMPRRVAAVLVGACLIALLGGRSLSMIFSVPMPSFVGNGTANGAVFPDQGLKAAAWWVRERTEPEQSVFADWIFEPYQMSYYFHRPFVAVTDAKEPLEAYTLLTSQQTPPTYYLVLPGNEHLLQEYASGTPTLRATVTVNGEPKLLIFGEGSGEPETIVAEQANALFDEQFGPWRSMFSIGTRK